MNNCADNQPLEFTKSNVQSLRRQQLNGDVELIEYSNSHEEIYYQRDDVHTLSIYQHGGYNTFPLQKKGKKGAPYLFNLLPLGSYSGWHVGGEQVFAHVHFSDPYIKRLMLHTFDIDPRCVSLPLLLFERNSKLKAILKKIILPSKWNDSANRISLEQASNLLLVQLITDYNLIKKSQNCFKGGLSVATKNRVIDYIEAHINETISLGHLAHVAQLSEYHFCRMFKRSLGETPHQFIMRARLEKIKHELKHNPEIKISDLAIKYGFTHQSHMGNSFKRLYTMTPKQYRCINS